MPPLRSYSCISCGDLAAERLGFCPGCCREGSYFAVTHKRLAGLVPDRRVVTAKQLWAQRGRFLPLNQAWQRVLVALPGGAGSWLLTCHGPAGCGKMTTTLGLAGHLADLGHVVLANLIETGFSTATSEILRRLELRSDQVLLACMAALGSARSVPAAEPGLNMFIECGTRPRVVTNRWNHAT
jgi:predicted ATP-dependent serine protease